MIRPFAMSLVTGPATGLAIAVAGLALPAAAQEAAGDKVNMVIVYGDDPCPRGTEGEIVVCARQDESERYRIPEDLRMSDDPANESWTKRVRSLEMVGDFGTMSCSPVGAGGFTGCTQQMINAAYADRRSGSSVRFGQLIAEARAERLSTINEDAAAEQERVEALEREYLERHGEKPGVQTPAAPAVVVAETDAAASEASPGDKPAQTPQSDEEPLPAPAEGGNS